MQDFEDERRLHNELDVEAMTRPEEEWSLWRMFVGQEVPQSHSNFHRQCPEFLQALTLSPVATLEVSLATGKHGEMKV